jgi:hypothetical protein
MEQLALILLIERHTADSESVSGDPWEAPG